MTGVERLPGAGSPLVGTEGAGVAAGGVPAADAFWAAAPFSGGGMYRGPVWPQPASSAANRAAAGSANAGFTIKITV